MQQRRIFPHIATTIALTIFYRKFISISYKHFIYSTKNEKLPYDLMLSREIHILSCAAKVLSTEEGVNALDDARLACGAYGFLKSSRLNDLRDAFDPARTFEGDNNILMQQVTYALISLYDEKSYDWNDSPLRSLIFLAMKPEKFSTWNDDALEDIANAYVWLLHFLISKVKDDISDKINQGIDKRLIFEKLNDLRNAFDPARTFEGDNNILMQQVTYALISLYDEKSYDWNDSPLRSLIFLAMKPEKFSTWNDDALEDIANAYVWLLHFLISKVKDDISDKINQGIDKRLVQSEQYKMITYAYCELTILNDFRNSLQKAPESIREVLHRCALLYAYSSIDKHIATFYIGGYCNNGQWGNTIKKRFRKLEAMILPDVITICDALSLPDFFLHSVLGLSDGQIYQHLIQYFMQFPIESSIDSSNSDNDNNNNNQ
uniref:ACOX domain-containing protein n=1 Tax=Brugia pahangi TaxID=6280 RepID=A0A0N4TZA4_BRUPA